MHRNSSHISGVGSCHVRMLPDCCSFCMFFRINISACLGGGGLMPIIVLGRGILSSGTSRSSGAYVEMTAWMTTGTSVHPLIAASRSWPAPPDRIKDSSRPEYTAKDPPELSPQHNIRERSGITPHECSSVIRSRSHCTQRQKWSTSLRISAMLDSGRSL